MKPLVSILIAAYNAEDWIAHTLTSALAQNWPRKEIILVDDGSTDSTLALASRLASPELKIVPQTHQGAATSRNKALEFAQGDYIQWLDSDDLLAPDKVEQQMTYALFGGSELTLFSSAWGRFYYRVAKTRWVRSSLWHDLTPVQWLSRKMNDNAWMAIESWLVSRRLAEAAGPWDTSLTADDDGEYFTRVVAASDGICFVPQARSLVRMANSGSLSKNPYMDPKLESQFRSLELQIATLRRLEESAATRAACLRYLQNWQLYFFPQRPDLVSKAKQLARELGGELTEPRLRWKYVPVQKLFGWKMAKTVARILPMVRAWIVRSWDRWLYLRRPDEPLASLPG